MQLCLLNPFFIASFFQGEIDGVSERMGGRIFALFRPKRSLHLAFSLQVVAAGETVRFFRKSRRISAVIVVGGVTISFEFVVGSVLGSRHEVVLCFLRLFCR